MLVGAQHDLTAIVVDTVGLCALTCNVIVAAIATRSVTARNLTQAVGHTVDSVRVVVYVQAVILRRTNEAKMDMQMAAKLAQQAGWEQEAAETQAGDVAYICNDMVLSKKSGRGWL